MVELSVQVRDKDPTIRRDLRDLPGRRETRWDPRLWIGDRWALDGARPERKDDPAVVGGTILQQSISDKTAASWHASSCDYVRCVLIYAA